MHYSLHVLVIAANTRGIGSKDMPAHMPNLGGGRDLKSLHVEKKKRKNYAGRKSHSPHQLRKTGHFGTEYREAPPLWKGKELSMGIRSVAGLA